MATQHSTNTSASPVAPAVEERDYHPAETMPALLRAISRGTGQEPTAAETEKIYDWAGLTHIHIALIELANADVLTVKFNAAGEPLFGVVPNALEKVSVREE